MIKKENVILNKSYEFAVEIVKTYKHLSSEKKEFVLSRQLLRSGTSIGANIEEAEGGISRKDFRAKMSISHKEARETSYWLRLLKDTDYLNVSSFQELDNRCKELLRILTAILKSTENKTDRNEHF